MKKITVSIVLVAFSWLPSIPAFAGVEVRLEPSRVEWIPAVEAERWVLTVSGPGEFLLRREFAGDKAPSLSLYDQAGDRLPDGEYSWELQGLLNREAGTPEPPVPSREKGRIFKQPREPRLQGSGHFSIVDGGFVPASPEPGAEPPESPLQNVIAKDSIFTGKLVNTGNACIGDQCNGLSDADFSALKLRSTLPHLKFDDVALPCEGCPTFDPHDWAVFVNQSDINQFAVSEYVDDVPTSTPFTLRGGAPSNSLFVDSIGHVGIGTASPEATLHVFGSNTADVFIGIGPNPDGSPGSESALNIGLLGASIGRGSGFLNVRPASGATAPNPSLRFYIANVERMIIDNAGFIGIGTSAPGHHLHVFGNAGTNKVLFEEANGTTAPRELLEIRNNGGTALILDDTSVAQRWMISTSGSNLLMDEQAHVGMEFVFTNTGNLTIAGVLTQGSSRDLKTDFSALAPQDVLARVSALPVSLWSYKTETGVRHAGPMAEDFHAAFGLGEDDKHIAPGDQAGIALLAVQGLNLALKEKDQEIADLQSRIKALEDLVKNLMQKAAPETMP